MREVKPSTAQRAVLELLAQGASIDPGVFGRYGPSIRGRANFRLVNRSTFEVMRKRGWIAESDTMLFRSSQMEWRITDAGRQALA